MKRLTLRDLGEQLGLSHMTVSLALREHPSIPKVTRDRVRAHASKAGYRPDPVLAALNSYRHANHIAAYQATLAWINTYAQREAYEVGVYKQYVEGMQERAGELGYKLEEFWVPDLAHWKRLAKILRARRIEGVIVPPPSAPDVEGYRIFPWKDFFAVAVGTSYGLSLHLIVNDQFQSAALAVASLHTLGYRRIGLAMPAVFARHTEFHFMGGYHTECARLKIPSLILLDESGKKDSYRKNTLAWLRRQRLDAVISSGPGDILPILQSANLKVPKDIAVAFLARQPDYPKFAGIDQNNHQIGVSAANHLFDLIRRNERGIPTLPLRHLIPGTWVNAASAPMKKVAR